jgi:hypothetical protein
MQPPIETRLVSATAILRADAVMSMWQTSTSGAVDARSPDPARNLDVSDDDA